MWDQLPILIPRVPMTLDAVVMMSPWKLATPVHAPRAPLLVSDLLAADRSICPLTQQRDFSSGLAPWFVRFGIPGVSSECICMWETRFEWVHCYKHCIECHAECTVLIVLAARYLRYSHRGSAMRAWGIGLCLAQFLKALTIFIIHYRPISASPSVSAFLWTMKMYWR